MNFKQNQEYICKNGKRLPIALSNALAEVEETAELIYDEVEEAVADLLYQDIALTDSVPTDLILQTLLHQLLICIRRVMDVDTVAVLLKTKYGQQLAVRAALGLEEEITEGIRIPLGRGFAGRIASQGAMMSVDDLSTVEVVSPILRNKGLQSMLGVPLLVKNEVIGVFHIGTARPRQFTNDDAYLLQLVADHVGLVVVRLKFLELSTPKVSMLNREEFASTHLLQQISRTIRNFHLGQLSTAFLLESEFINYSPLLQVAT